MNRMKKSLLEMLAQRARILAEYEPNGILGEGYAGFLFHIRRKWR